jgi:hypothetical protein
MNDYELAMEGMSSLLSEYEKYLASFSRSSYSQNFMDYYRSIVPALDAVENLFLNVKEPDTMLENMSSALARSAQQILEQSPKRKKEQVNINLSLMMAGYVFPALLQYRGASSKPLVDHVLASWKEAFPKSNLSAAPFETIEQGFHRKWCYITTAACAELGRSDDCYELNLLREYRDGYLAKLENGGELIRSYYDVAPTIVKHISKRPDASAIYHRIWESYISPCIRMIEDGRMEECRVRYEEMVHELKERYFYLYPNVKTM